MFCRRASGFVEEHRPFNDLLRLRGQGLEAGGQVKEKLNFAPQPLNPSPLKWREDGIGVI